jgi:hypothetical protein
VALTDGSNGSDPPRARVSWNVGHAGVAVVWLVAGAGLYALITPAYRRLCVVLSVLTTLGIGGGIYLYSFAVRLGQCLS